MIERFVDTSGWAEVTDRTLLFHTAAVASCREVSAQGGRLVTTSLVVIELTGLLTRLRISKPQQVQLVEDLQNDPTIEVVPIDPALESAAWQLWKARLDKEWSLVDCASFVVMQQRGLTEAITTDHHFEQAGFIRLLK